MKFSPEFIERVSSANNLVDLISQYTTLKPAGGGLMGRCPFPDHPEKTPSFSVSESKQVYNCFGCHKKGNIFKFLETYNGMSFPEAVEYLANRANIALPVVDREQSEKLDQLTAKKRKILQANALTEEFFRIQFANLPKNHPAKIYADKRGLVGEILEIFKIGYAPAEWDSLIQFLTLKGISVETMLEARLIKARSTGTGYFDLFRDRLMFSIRDQKNEVVAFGGRILVPGDVKYMNSPETLVFSKSKTLYGISETSKYIRSEDQAIVVEGYMDLVALYQAGIKNVVAPMGTALTFEQSRLLRRQTQNVIVLFDGDDAGKNAAEKSLPVLLDADLHPKGLTLPDELDPDEFVKQRGAEFLRELLGGTKDLFSVVLERWLVDYRGEASQKIQLIDRLKPVFSSIVDPRLKDLYVDEVAHRLNVDARWLKTQLGSERREEPKSAPTKAAAAVESSVSQPGGDSGLEKIVLKGATPAENQLVALVLKNRANFLYFLESESLDKILHAGVKKLLERSAGVYRQDPDKFDRLVGLLTDFVDLPELLFVPESLSHIDPKEESRLLQDCINRIRERHLKYQAHVLLQEMKAPTGELIDNTKLEQIMNLQRDRLALKRAQTEEKGAGKAPAKREDDSDFK